eukprot:m51a1_g2613 hypothetical protein (277) ;mRNA; r:510589-511589
MRTAFALCALAALALAQTYTLDNFNSYRDGQIVVSRYEAAMGASQIEFSFNFGVGNPGRRVILSVGESIAEAETAPLAVKRFRSALSFDTYTYTFSLESVNCSSGCTLYVSLLAECPMEVCVHSITSNFWARLQDSNGAYIYGLSKAHPIELTPDFASPDLTLNKGTRNYFTFVHSETSTMPVVFSGNFGSIAVGGSTITWNDPQNTTTGGFIQLTKTEDHLFSANQKTYYVVTLAGTFSGDVSTYNVCIGANCTGGAAAVVVSFVSLLSALALFF